MENFKKNYKILKKSAFLTLLCLVVAVPISFWKGFQNSFDLVKSSVIFVFGGVFFIISAALLFFKQAKNHKNAYHLFFYSKLDFFILIFFSVVLISTIFSVNPFISFTGSYERQIGLLLFIVMILIYFLSSGHLNGNKNILMMIVFMELTGVLTAAYAIGVFLGFDIFNLRPLNFTRPFTNIGHPVFTAGFITLIFPFSLLNISEKENRIARITFPLILITGVIVTMTRASYAAIAVQLLVTAIAFPATMSLDNKKLKLYRFLTAASALIILITGISAILFFPENPFVKRVVSIASISEQARWFLWKDSLTMSLSYPLTGTGLGLFSNVFENFAGYALKLSELNKSFDNAHNNFINILCTTGFPGLIAYLLVIVFSIYYAVKNFQNDRKFFIAFICTISGYIVYGLADFDDLTILLYLFLMISVLKMKIINLEKNSSHYLINIPRQVILLITPVMMILSVYLVYTAYVKLLSEKYYSDAVKSIAAGNITEYNYKMGEALKLQPDNGIYRFNHAFNLFSLAVSNPTFNEKQILFNNARNEAKKCLNNYNSRNECITLLTFIELESGNIDEAMRMKDDLLSSDSCQFRFRNNMARYYIKTKQDSLAEYELNILLKYDPKGLEVLLTKVLYFEANAKYNEAAEVCLEILKIDSDNREAMAKLRKFKPLLKK